MKKLVTLSLAAVLALSLAAGVSAEEGQGVVKVGTAKVDGILDDAYNYSLSLPVGVGENLYTGSDTYDWPGDCHGTVYLMYDKTNLYICAVIEDNDVLTAGEARASDRMANPYDNDVIELRLSFDGSGSTATAVKVAIDAYGYGIYGLKNHYDIIDYDAIEYAATHTDTSYIVECAIPCTKGYTDMIAAGKIGFTYQLCDLDETGAYKHFTHSYVGETAKTPVLYNLSTEKAEAPAADQGGTTTGGTSTEGTTTGGTTEGTTTAPSTFDPALIAVALTAASGAAFVFASKKH